jgi:hypothetical protein
MSNFKLNRPLLNGTFSGYPVPTLLFWNSGWITGNPHLPRRWPFERVTEGLPTIQDLSRIAPVGLLLIGASISQVDYFRYRK